MMQPLKRWQKVIGYGSLAIVLVWTAWGLYVVWLLLSQPNR